MQALFVLVIKEEKEPDTQYENEGSVILGMCCFLPCEFFFSWFTVSKTSSPRYIPSPSTSSKLSILPYHTPKWLLSFIPPIGCTNKLRKVPWHSILPWWTWEVGWLCQNIPNKTTIVPTCFGEEVKRKEWTTWADAEYVIIGKKIVEKDKKKEEWKQGSLSWR